MRPSWCSEGTWNLLVMGHLAMPKAHARSVYEGYTGISTEASLLKPDAPLSTPSLPNNVAAPSLTTNASERPLTDCKPQKENAAAPKQETASRHAQ
ncbi:uncharacterized protein LTR77_005713 [Saxophila tyrrhenica]|uniref:Uncharacterized protein n=1 Tax=Saxophila tyrrhenica TaxID=1690608 RepID=A0AAV9PDI6_9PEZI|nr:hypothetical protein LTR77_005713 [Saxophila tyrrhenica]